MPTLRDKLVELIQPVIGDEVLIFSNQNTSRPPLPYWTLRVDSQRQVGVDAYDQGTDDAGNLKVFGVREATISVQRIGVDSDIKVADFRDELSKISVLENWYAADIALYDVGDMLNVPFTMDSEQIETRWVIDLFVRFGTELLDNVGIIETVDIDAEYDETIDEIIVEL